MAELADATDLKSVGQYVRVGSSPTRSTNFECAVMKNPKNHSLVVELNQRYLLQGT